MQVWIVGQGQLATELLKGLRVDGTVAAWPGADCARGQPSVVVHAGSGRELDAVVAYCRASQSPLIELSTGSALEGQDMGFAVVVSFAYVLVNLLVDLLYLWIDPRMGRGEN